MELCIKLKGEIKLVLSMNKDKCILFILKNDEKFLVKNLEEIYELSNLFDLFFIVRDDEDLTIDVLRSNNFNYIHIPYDSGYNEALSIGLEFVQKINYECVIEFGQIKNTPLSEIFRLYNIYKQDSKKIVFGSRMSNCKFEYLKKGKIYIWLAIFRKVYDPYSKFKIYNKDSLRCIRTCFDNKLEPYNFIQLLYLNKDNFKEVKINYKKRNEDVFYKKISVKFSTYIYTLFITPFIKRFKIDKCSL